MEFKLSKYVHISKDDDVLPDAFYLYATRTGAAIELETKYHDDVLQENWKALPLKVIDTLMLAEAIVPVEQNELDYVLTSNKENIKDNDKKFLSFTIQPTANCQLGCHYCGQQHVKKVASTETNDAIYNRIIGKVLAIQETLQSLSVSWYGGEPLTGLSSIEQLSKQLISYCDNNNIFYSASIVTNALALKMSTFKTLVSKYKITSFQITIDGTAEFHDQRRMLKTGAPSFDIIFNNVKEIVHSDFFKDNKADINIRCNVDAQNKDNIITLLEMMHEHGILDKVGFNTAPIHDWGDNGASQINGISKDDYAQFEIDVLLKLHSYGLLRRGRLIPLRNYNVCMVANSQSEVYDAYGNVSTCWEVPYTPVYDNTEYYAGNLHTNPNIDSTKVIMRDWFNEIPTNDSWCKGCKFLPVCGGGCPKHWNSGSAACPSFKKNIDERLFLSKFVSLDNAQSSVLN
ncbi:radical SAM protein [Mucilaginibacter sp. OK283]|jgi:uncharacterized protein|uniref:radical SAM protein n=1 Tax=Mucilaginibacter sp. OK283 TaxID=1881049 RepID=UPI0008CDEA6B|nr:radical SAM protein [Mucilaginibacter sp. OK283]SEP41544.1 uncharacterized protein SAMN05428947_11598 [Mucilaginibacter sp. OK283]